MVELHFMLYCVESSTYGHKPNGHSYNSKVGAIPPDFPVFANSATLPDIDNRGRQSVNIL